MDLLTEAMAGLGAYALLLAITVALTAVLTIVGRKVLEADDRRHAAKVARQRAAKTAARTLGEAA